jgi:quinoprotein glucose dehydrogenase
MSLTTCNSLVHARHALLVASVIVIGLFPTGAGSASPPVTLSPRQRADLIDFLFRRHQLPTSKERVEGETSGSRYTFAGYNFLVDDRGYPGIKPPWGLLNCYDLNTGRILRRVPLGEHEELTREGVPLTGSQNMGGATATAGGLVFVAGTADRKLRAFDSGSGKELWSAKLPFAGTAAPAVYEVAGRQYVAITATGGGRVGGPAGDAYVAFTLKKYP